MSKSSPNSASPASFEAPSKPGEIVVEIIFKFIDSRSGVMHGFVNKAMPGLTSRTSLPIGLYTPYQPHTNPAARAFWTPGSLTPPLDSPSWPYVTWPTPTSRWIVHSPIHPIRS